MHKINIFFGCFGHHFLPQISPMSRACTGTLLFHNAPIPTNSQRCTRGRWSRRRGVLWCEQGLAGVALGYIISDEPSCAVLFRPWVKLCQPS